VLSDDIPGIMLFLASSFYAVAYLYAERGGQQHSDLAEGFLFSNAREASFTGCLLVFVAAMTLVTRSQHLGLLWVAVEVTTLASAPLMLKAAFSPTTRPGHGF